MWTNDGIQYLLITFDFKEFLICEVVYSMQVSQCRFSPLSSQVKEEMSLHTLSHPHPLPPFSPLCMILSPSPLMSEVSDMKRGSPNVIHMYARGFPMGAPIGKKIVVCLYVHIFCKDCWAIKHHIWHSDQVRPGDLSSGYLHPAPQPFSTPRAAEQVFRTREPMPSGPVAEFELRVARNFSTFSGAKDTESRSSWV